MADNSISVGNVDGNGNVFGHGSSSVVDLSTPQQNLMNEFYEFMSMLEQHKEAVPNADEVKQTAAAAKDAITAKHPNKHLIGALLNGIAMSVGKVSALAEAIDKIRAATAHLFQ
jgi:hypothetical protein